MKALKERIWFDESIEMLTKSPKEYYRGIFNEVVEEIKENNKFVKNFDTCLTCPEL